MHTDKQNQVSGFFRPFPSSWVLNELPEVDAVSAEVEQNGIAEGWEEPNPAEAPGCLMEMGFAAWPPGPAASCVPQSLQKHHGDRAAAKPSGWLLSPSPEEETKRFNDSELPQEAFPRIPWQGHCMVISTCDLF